MFLRETSVYYKTHSSNANLENRRLQAILYSKITPENHEKLFIGGKVGVKLITETLHKRGRAEREGRGVLKHKEVFFYFLPLTSKSSLQASL